MFTWQRLVRVGLASFVVTFGVAVMIGVRERPAPAADVPVDQADPDAVLQGRRVRITLGDGSIIEADRQFAYDDGSVRLLGVEVIVPAGEDRTGFRIRGGEAAGIEQEGEWRLARDVRLETADGLAGRTSEASYADATGLVTMPAPAVFEEGWMRLAGEAARYDRRDGLLYLDERAIVALDGAGETGESDAGQTLIEARTARIARLDGEMRFVGDVRVDAAGRGMDADEVVVRFDSEASRLEGIELMGNARIDGGGAGDDQLRELSASRISVDYENGALGGMTLSGGARVQGGNASPGRLQEMAAPEIRVTYAAGVAERAVLEGGARVELFGDPVSAPGATIASRSMDLELAVDAGGIELLQAREHVEINLPAAGGVVRRIAADALDLGGNSGAPGPRGDPDALDRSGDPDVALREEAGAGLRDRTDAGPGEETDLGGAADAGSMPAMFDGNVAYVERRPDGAEPGGGERIVRAERLEAALDNGLTKLMAARFLRDVVLEAGRVTGQADEATYAPDGDTFALVSSGAGGRPPRVDDRWGSIQATTVVVGLDGPDIEATGNVRGLLTSEGAGADSGAGDGAGFTRPGLFDEGPRIYAAANHFAYDAAQSLATYTGGARIWQGLTEVRGGAIVLDDATGSIRAEGGVQTRTTMLQTDDVTDEPAAVTSEARAEAFAYDHVHRQATYTTDAVLESDGSVLRGGTIDLFLGEDARTLQRIVAAAEVQMVLDSRRAEGETLTYRDADGRYDLTGAPVRVLVEETSGTCRETTGRAVTFYRTRDDMSIDGQSEARTASMSVPCP